MDFHPFLHPFLILVNGGWSNWTDWTNCSKTCGFDGNQTKSRKCDNPEPQHNGTDCTGLDVLEQKCANISCPGNVVLYALNENSNSRLKLNFR